MARHSHEDAQKTRKAILDSALRLFSRRGFERTSLFDIAKYAGVTRGAIYWHFDDKRDLLLELYDRTDRELLSSSFLVNATKIEEENPLDCLRSWMLSHSDEKSIQFFRSSFFELFGNIFRGTIGDDELRQRFMKLVEFRRRTFMDILKNCVRKGQLPANLDVKAAADYLMVFMGGYVHTLRTAFSADIVDHFPFYVDMTLKELSHFTVDLVGTYSSVRI